MKASVRACVPVGYVDGSLGQAPHNIAAAAASPTSTASRTSAARAAAAADDATTLAALAAAGWDPSRGADSSDLPLHWAAGAGALVACALLVDDLNVPVDLANKSGRTALHWAARNGRAAACEWLTKRGASVESTTADGINVFHWSVWSADLETCRWAASSGVDVTARNRWGCTCVHWAAATGSLSLCKWLRDGPVGADFRAQNNQGHDALFKAAWNGHRALAEWLLDTDPCAIEHYNIVRDRAGLVASDLARLNGHDELAALIEARLAVAEAGAPAAAAAAAKARAPGLRNKAFEVYCQTQQVMETEEWEQHHRDVFCAPPRLLRVLSSSDPMVMRAVAAAQFCALPWLLAAPTAAAAAAAGPFVNQFSFMKLFSSLVSLSLSLSLTRYSWRVPLPPPLSCLHSLQLPRTAACRSSRCPTASGALRDALLRADE